MKKYKERILIIRKNTWLLAFAETRWLQFTHANQAECLVYGYAGGTVNNICKTGINKGLIYHNFAGKDELYLTCLKYSCEKLIQYVNEQGGATNLKRYMAVRIDFFNTFSNEAHIFLMLCSIHRHI